MRRAAVAAVIALSVAGAVRADKTHSQTSRGNRFFRKGEYERALEIYDKALLEAPQEHRLHANRGSALYKLNRFEEADTAYQQALQLKDRSALADIHYNRGNALFRQGEAMMQGPQAQNAMEKFKAALAEYAQALDLRPTDRDAKWNLQLAYNRIQQLQQMAQNQQQNNNQNDKNQKRDNQNKGDQQSQNQQDKNQNQQGEQEQDRNNQRPPAAQQPPQPQTAEEQMKKDEAKRLIGQFADDDKNLNKPMKPVKAGERRMEKDW